MRIPGIRSEEPAFHLVPVGSRLSDVVPSREELEATAALQAETAAMLDARRPHGRSLMEELQREGVPAVAWSPGGALRRAQGSR